MPRPYRRRPPASYLALAVLVLLIIFRAGWDYVGVDLPTDAAPDTAAVETGGLIAGPCEVVRVVDGDTLILRQQTSGSNAGPTEHGRPSGPAQYRVRLLGIDTPETVKEGTAVEAWGPEATKFAREFVRTAPVRVELDKRRVDRFGRSLAYVYVGDDMLNVELVRAGLARVSSYPGDSMAMLRLLRQAEADARQAKRGLWGDRPQPTGIEH